VVCIKHFAPQFIITHDSAIRPDGSVLTVRRPLPKLSDDAYPSLFESCPSYLWCEPPRKRRSLDDRRDDVDKRDLARFEDYMMKEKLADFEQLVSTISTHVSGDWKITRYDNCLVLYVLNITDSVLSVTANVTIMTDLSTVVCQSGARIDSCKLVWLLGDGCKLDYWSKLSSLLSHVQAVDTVDRSVDEKIGDVCVVLKDLCSDDDIDQTDDEAKWCRVMNFVIEQLTLLRNGQNRYSAEFLRFSFQIFSLSSTAYNCLRDNFVILPYPSYLRALSKCFGVEPGIESNAHIAYLTQKENLLSEHERYVSLLLDEIYVNPYLL
jgi:hypothetical protein